MDKPRVLIVDDDEDVRTQMRWALAEQYDVLLAEDRPAAIEVFGSRRPALVTLDLGLPPHAGDVREGFAALADLLRIDPRAKVVIITGQDDRKNALEAVAQGAYDFFCKPIDLQELGVVLKRAAQLADLEREHRELLRAIPVDELGGMIGSSAAMQRVFADIRKLATTDAPVLIVGESGTGKELAARAIHRLGARSAGPFVAINCGAIPETLLESELFGHEKGAFTGAHVQRPGRVETASGGTLFLDEIGELPALLQVKLLRFLQEHQIERIGGRRPIAVDTRVISATNLDLATAMAGGTFREDLYYRLGVVTLAMPPLRERAGDIVVLAKFFLARHAAEQGKQLGFTQKALATIERHGWPGNVRELENRIRRAVIMAEEKLVTPQDLELDAPDTEHTRHGLVRARQAVERELIQRAMLKHKGNLSRVAAELDISRPTLYDLMEKLGIERVKGVAG